MTKNQILDIHAHTLRANFQQMAAACSYADPNSEVGDYLINAEIRAYNNLVYFYVDNMCLFNEVEATIMDKTLKIWHDAGDELTDEEANALTDAQCELYDYYNENIDEDGYFCEE